MGINFYVLGWFHAITQLLGFIATACTFAFFIARADASHAWHERLLLPMMFSFGAGIEPILFTLGAIWHFEPERFPNAFCRVSSIAFNLGAYCMTVVGLTFALTTYESLRECRRGNYELIRRPWRVPVNGIPFFLLYPVTGCSLFTALSLHFDAIGPEGIWICDIARPGYMWLRLLGYGGIDTLATVPAAVASAMSLRLLYKIHLDDRRKEDMRQNDFVVYHPDVARSPRPKATEGTRSLLPSMTNPYPQPESVLKNSDRHRPVQPPMIAGLRKQVQAAIRESEAGAGSDEGSSAAGSSGAGKRVSVASPKSFRRLSLDKDSPNINPHAADRTFWMDDDDRASLRTDSHGHGDDGADTKFSIGRMIRAARSQPELLLACYRIMFFDVMFTVVQILAAGSTLHAIATGRPPPGYSSAYIAVILAVWGPALVFSINPLVLDRIFGNKWRRVLNWLEKF